MPRFRDVPVESDTVIKYSKEINVGNLEVLHQKWVWEGIIAESLIFVEEDVGEMEDQEIIALARKSGLLSDDSDTTIVRNRGGYTFLNINFNNPI